MTLYVLGVDSSPNPDAGVGIARSIRDAFPSCRLVAVDHDETSSGLHWPQFDETMIVKDDESLLRLVGSLGAEDFLLPCVDHDIAALSGLADVSDRILAPPTACIHAAIKPARAVGDNLGLSVPPTIDANDDPARVHAFTAIHRPFVWHKGYRAGAARLDTLSARDAGLVGLLQAHIEGRMECCALAAADGMLLDAIWMTKRTVTDLGKTWSGTVEPCEPEFRKRLASFVKETGWHGGGTIETIRDSSGVLWLIDVNLRFPAWVHGATLCGWNLVATLMAYATGARQTSPVGLLARAFTRVVLEIPQLT